ncbi:MAG: hypothetical protein K2Q22_02245 [Cytophagales bacterium]|nr:hypothetical protein [Cytophagales bacterium]
MTIIPLESRAELEQKRDEQLQKIRQGVAGVKKEVSNKMLVIGVAGAGLFIGYLVYSLFFKKDSKVVFIPKQKGNADAPVPVVETVPESPIVSAIRGYIVTFLLSLAKQKVQQFLDELYKNDDSNDIQRTA